MTPPLSIIPANSRHHVSLECAKPTVSRHPDHYSILRRSSEQPPLRILRLSEYEYKPLSSSSLERSPSAVRPRPLKLLPRSREGSLCRGGGASMVATARVQILMFALSGRLLLIGTAHGSDSQPREAGNNHHQHENFKNIEGNETGGNSTPDALGFRTKPSVSSVSIQLIVA